jgi:hypothetical protein
MSDAVQVPPSASLRTKNLVFAGIAVMVAYVLYHNESFLIDPMHPVWQHYEPFKWWLLPHGLAGACALVLAPMQFSDRLRARLAKVHRITGRVYDHDRDRLHLCNEANDPAASPVDDAQLRGGADVL